nr:integrase, catalytic region, zinc finger, CCHC-type, peptidase aspartic, catalytic [Tanacetum cinerariifolium]
LYAYLKQYEKHATHDRMIIERLSPPSNDPLAFVSSVQPHVQSSYAPHQSSVAQSNQSLVKEVMTMKAVFENMEAEVDQNAIDKKCDEIERKNLLITNEKLIANCIAQESRAVKLEAENSKLLAKIQNDDHDSTVKHFSKLEIDHLNLQLKYQHLKENIRNSKSKTSKDALEFEAFFELKNRMISFKLTETLSYQHLKENIKNSKSKTSKDALEFEAFFELKNGMISFKLTETLSDFEKTCKKRITPTGITEGERVFENMEAEVDQNAIDKKCDEIERKNLLITNEKLIANCIAQENDQLQAHRNTIRKLKDQISPPKVKNSDVVGTFDHKSLESQNVTHVQTIEKTTSLQNEIKNLKIQLRGKMPCVTSDVATPKVSACDKYAIDVEPIPLRLRNNKEVHLDYLKHLKESVETLRDIIEEAKVVQIFLWYLDSGCLKNMTEDRSRLRNFVKKIIGKVRFRNDHFGAIKDYEDYVIGDSVIFRVYYVERLGHNLFSV